MRRRRIRYSINTECDCVEIKMDKEFTQLNTETEHIDTVVSFSSSMFKVSEFIKFVKEAFQEKGLYVLQHKLGSRGGIPSIEDPHKWCQQGIDCELLKPGTQGWKKGKIRIKISLEFSPDEPEINEISVNQQVNVNQPESPLDDIRRTMNQNS